MIAGLIALGLATTGGAVGLATAGGDEPKATPRSDDPKPAAKAGAERPEPPLAEKLDRLKAEYEAADRAFHALYRGSTIPEENLAKAAEIQPDFPAVVRRIADLAATAPKDPAVRDAMLWVIGQAQRRRHGLYAGEFALAANWLVRHFGDDPDAVRVGLELDNWPNLRPRQPAAELLRLGQGPRIEGTGPAGAGAVSRTQGHDGRGGQEGGRPADVSPTTISSARTGRSIPRRRSCPTRSTPTSCT